MKIETNALGVFTMTLPYLMNNYPLEMRAKVNPPPNAQGEHFIFTEIFFSLGGSIFYDEKKTGKQEIDTQILLRDREMGYT